MNSTDLIAQYQRLKAKIAASRTTWHSGRIDRLVEALRSVERELRERHLLTADI